MEELEKFLVQEGWIQTWQLDVARLEATSERRSLWASLVRRGFLSEEDIAAFFAHASGVAYVRVWDYAIAPHVLHLLEENFCIQNVVIPLFKTEEALFVACANPFNTALVDELAKMTGMAIEPLVASTHAILGAVDLYFKLDERSFEISRYVMKPVTVSGVSQWRAAERLPFSGGVSVTVLDETVTLMSRQPVEGKAINLSADGSAIGIELGVYLPKGLAVALVIHLPASEHASSESMEARGEILRSGMLRNRTYLLGIRFVGLDQQQKQRLLDAAASKKQG